MAIFRIDFEFNVIPRNVEALSRNYRGNISDIKLLVSQGWYRMCKTQVPRKLLTQVVMLIRQKFSIKAFLYFNRLVRGQGWMLNRFFCIPFETFSHNTDKHVII